jgi:DNA transformation protein
MKPVSEFVVNLNEVFVEFGQIEAKRMFGGYGIYRDGLMFALVADDELYLKADANSAHSFIELGLPQFEYEKNGKKMKMSYYSAPDGIFDDPALAKEWADRAYGAALRTKAPKKKSKAKMR